MRVPIFLSPGALGLPPESVQFKSSDDVNLRGWWIHHDDPEAVVVFSHGFLMNRAEPTPMAKRFYESGCACLLYDFRRHGLSGGRISTVGLAERLDVERLGCTDLAAQDHLVVVLVETRLARATDPLLLSAVSR